MILGIHTALVSLPILLRNKKPQLTPGLIEVCNEK